jgi:hypothetical protein
MTIPAISTPAPNQPTPLVPNSSPASNSGPSFKDVLDAVNPLQHIPVVSTIYRAVTGSHISAASEVAGDTLYGVLLPGGAVAGLASSVADVAVKQVTGKSIGQLMTSAVTPSQNTPPSASSSPAVPLVASTSPVPVPPLTSTSTTIAISLSKAQQITNGQYEHAQALDAINNRLVKMAV